MLPTVNCLPDLPLLLSGGVVRPELPALARSRSASVLFFALRNEFLRRCVFWLVVAVFPLLDGFTGGASYWRVADAPGAWTTVLDDVWSCGDGVAMLCAPSFIR